MHKLFSLILGGLLLHCNPSNASYSQPLWEYPFGKNKPVIIQSDNNPIKSAQIYLAKSQTNIEPPKAGENYGYSFSGGYAYIQEDFFVHTLEQIRFRIATGITTPLTILEIGAGKGHNALFFWKLFQKEIVDELLFAHITYPENKLVRYVLNDIDPAMQNSLRHTFQTHNPDYLMEFVVNGDPITQFINQTPDSYYVIDAFSVLHYLNPAENTQTIIGIQDRLNDGGTLFTIDNLDLYQGESVFSQELKERTKAGSLFPHYATGPHSLLRNIVCKEPHTMNIVCGIELYIQQRQPFAPPTSQLEFEQDDLTTLYQAFNLNVVKAVNVYQMVNRVMPIGYVGMIATKNEPLQDEEKFALIEKAHLEMLHLANLLKKPKINPQLFFEDMFALKKFNMGFRRTIRKNLRL